MPVSVESMASWCRCLLGADPAAAGLSLTDYLEAVPRLDSLSEVPWGTPVLVRGDVDAQPGPNLGDGDIRLRSMVETLQFGRQRGWKQVVFGHIGRKAEEGLEAVARRLGELLDCRVPLIEDWLDESSIQITESAARAIARSQPGDVLMLQNTRRYKIEKALHKATLDDVDQWAEPLAKLAQQYAERIARVYVNEAFAAGSLDSSSTIVPAAMDRVALGTYVAGQYDGPMKRCLRAELVIFSGLKIDKLDDLEAIVDRGNVRCVLAAGSLAMALKKAEARLAGGDFCLGVAEDPQHRDKPYYIEPARVEQARRMIESGRKKAIQFVLPVDFVLQDGRASATIGPGDQQFDVGPETSKRYAERVGQFIASSADPSPHASPKVAFHNGVFGKFEEPRFETGTRRFIAQLKRMTDAGIEVYVGGGEGGAALERYGQPDWVTHCFTAGGTVLNALGSKPVPYLQALRMAAAL